MKVWQCTVCKYIHREATPPERCPVCGVDKSKFIEIDEELIPPRPVRKAVEKPAAQPGKTGTPEKKFDKIKSLVLKHHIHPISVHMPNGILPAAVILWILAWVFNSELLAKTAMINMIVVVLALPVVILTGILEWRGKYHGVLTVLFKLKILAATLTTVSCVISLIWYLADPEILSGPKALTFILVNVIMVAAAGVAGYIGGKFVFKD